MTRRCHLLNIIIWSLIYNVYAWNDIVADLLIKGDVALSENKIDKAIEYYQKGIKLLPLPWSSEDGLDESTSDVKVLPSELKVIISIHTNYATALSLQEGSTIDVAKAYRIACLCYRKWKKSFDGSDNDDIISNEITQAYFYLGMTYQDLSTSSGQTNQQEEYLQQATRSYVAATKLDPQHWSSFANMGTVLADVGSVSLKLYEEGILSYQKAISILTDGDKGDNEKGLTNPPENVREVVAELEYRVGLCLVPFIFDDSSNDSMRNDEKDYNKRICTLHINSKPTKRSCLELAAYQFSTALQYDPKHEGANNLLTMVTADASFGMSTDIGKVKNLFESYADDFEHSLVDELGYDGFHRMRSGFDRAMVLEGRSKENQFELVIDAGCGTGLSGEVFRNISQTLVGVDLSDNIINQSKQRRPGLYDTLISGDIIEVLNQHKRKVDLLVASDTFIYFNDVKNLFSAIHDSLKDGGYAVFSLENVSADNEKRLDQLKPDWHWQIGSSGRIAHRKSYIEDTAKDHSLTVVSYEKLDSFRTEKGVGVRGHFFVLKKGIIGKDEL